MNKNQPRRKPTTKGSRKPVEAAVGNKRSRAFLVTIENDGQDATGRIVGTNGIAWRVA